MRRGQTAAVAAVVLMSLLLAAGPVAAAYGTPSTAAGTAGASSASVTDASDVSVSEAPAATPPTEPTTAQMDNDTGNTSANDSAELPVEPPTQQALPSYEEVRQPNDTEAKVELGKKLYFDPRLSDTGSISCNTCHNVMEGGDGSRQVGRGVHGQTGPRNSPTVWNAVFMSTQFWDGRADTLEEQAKGPITAGVEMGMPSSGAAMEKIRSNPGYVELYEDVYGGENPVTLNNTVDAIAAYERTLITPNSSYDRYVRGDADALTEEQLQGMQKFKELGCQSCHSGPAFNGPQWQMENGNGYYQQLGVYSDSNAQCQEYIDRYNLYADSGRAGVTGDDADEHMYKVPTLRNTEYTAPYFHNGRVRTLENATKVMASCQLDQNITDEEAEQVTAFLTSLSGEFPEQDVPRIPSRSGGPPMLPENAGEASAPDDGGSSTDNTESVGTPESGDASTEASTEASADMSAEADTGTANGSTVSNASFTLVTAAAILMGLLLAATHLRQRD
ncbi:cytochrome-c peroxidase [Haloplanus ruber]|uniref:Cytochrome-c peroxidase n=1 Tax=Haloplanus ruber TaxID=869892 RepID=A0ABD6CTU7_9EURY|nr:cytochrome c peroxidase [Haloplanus ruber]